MLSKKNDIEWKKRYDDFNEFHNLLEAKKKLLRILDKNPNDGCTMIELHNVELELVNKGYSDVY